jgi:hypothetical protein
MRPRPALLFLLVTAACGGGGPEPAPGLPDAAAFSRWAEAAPFAGFETPEDFRNRFGPPESRDAVPQENRHVEGQTDSILTLTFEGPIEVRFYAITGGRTLPMSVEVRGSGILTDPVDVGTPWSRVVAAFGPPAGERDGRSYYLPAGDGAEEPVLFAVSGGRVAAIRFTYYVD